MKEDLREIAVLLAGYVLMAALAIAVLFAALSQS
jgi:hypothetical protein